MDGYLVLWQRRVRREHLRCAVIQIGEDEFELRLWSNGHLLLSEDFDDEERMLACAAQLERDASTGRAEIQT